MSSSKGFTDPFRYSPHPLVQEAAREVTARIDGCPELHEAFSEGKMLGILLVEPPHPHPIPHQDHPIPGPSVIPGLTRNLPEPATLHYIAAFSGSAGGRSHIEGFVPPIFDLLDPSGHFKTHEAEITAVNNEINSLETSSKLLGLRRELSDAERAMNEEITLMKARMAISKRRRDEIRSELSDSSQYAELIRESQFEKAELRRLKQGWEEKISILKEGIASIGSEIEDLKSRRARMSDELQDWIFRQYIVHNSLGEESSIRDIFAAQGLTPPGGTGDCAAPKLLEYAFRNGLKPLAMGEFWYGASPDTAVRTPGHFYPSCTSKCGPLLDFMLRGMELCHDEAEAGMCGGNGLKMNIIYEDEALLAVDKPSGMPSVPGLDGRESAYERLKMCHDELYAVHRLDMDTSGILLFGKTQSASSNLQRQFEEHTVHKTYTARLSACPEGKALEAGDRGMIELPLSPDYDERPRQKVDRAQGKPALTAYEVTSVNPDGTIDIIFNPHTGRTHQLRVHAAHTLGLARPILGDLLYGGSPAPRLHLHAAAVTFRHPATGNEIILTSSETYSSSHE